MDSQLQEMAELASPAMAGSGILDHPDDEAGDSSEGPLHIIKTLRWQDGNDAAAEPKSMVISLLP
jgi:hypothetical protein